MMTTADSAAVFQDLAKLWRKKSKKKKKVSEWAALNEASSQNYSLSSK